MTNRNHHNQRHPVYKPKLIETLKGLVTAAMYKAKSVTGEYNMFWLEFGPDEIETYPTQEAAHKGFVRRERDKNLAMGRSVTT